MRQIPDRKLFIGPIADLDDPAAVCRQGIEAVVILAAEPLPDPWPRDLIVARIPLSDDDGNTPSQLARAVDFVTALLEDEVAVLIVCSAGLSRSVAVAATALVRCQDSSPVEALRRVSDGRPTDVSAGLWHSLLKLPNKTFGNDA